MWKWPIFCGLQGRTGVFQKCCCKLFMPTGVTKYGLQCEQWLCLRLDGSLPSDHSQLRGRKSYVSKFQFSDHITQLPWNKAFEASVQMFAFCFVCLNRAGCQSSKPVDGLRRQLQFCMFLKRQGKICGFDGFLNCAWLRTAGAPWHVHFGGSLEVS